MLFVSAASFGAENPFPMRLSSRAGPDVEPERRRFSSVWQIVYEQAHRSGSSSVDDVTVPTSATSPVSVVAVRNVKASTPELRTGRPRSARRHGADQTAETHDRPPAVV